MSPESVAFLENEDCRVNAAYGGKRGHRASVAFKGCPENAACLVPGAYQVRMVLKGSGARLEPQAREASVEFKGCLENRGHRVPAACRGSVASEVYLAVMGPLEQLGHVVPVVCKAFQGCVVPKETLVRKARQVSKAPVGSGDRPARQASRGMSVRQVLMGWTVPKVSVEDVAHKAPQELRGTVGNKASQALMANAVSKGTRVRKVRKGMLAKPEPKALEGNAG